MPLLFKNAFLATDAGTSVGIGTTDTAGAKLRVAGDVKWTGTLQEGQVPWSRLTSFPAGCSSGQFITTLAGTPTCTTGITSEGDPTVKSWAKTDTPTIPGPVAVSSNLTVSGQNVCRQDGTNCPALGGGSGAPGKIGAIWTEYNTSASVCPLDYFSGPSCSGSSISYVPGSWQVSAWTNPQSILIVPTFTYQSYRDKTYTWWAGCQSTSCVNAPGSVVTGAGSCASGWSKNGFNLSSGTGFSRDFYMCTQ